MHPQLVLYLASAVGKVSSKLSVPTNTENKIPLQWLTANSAYNQMVVGTYVSHKSMTTTYTVQVQGQFAICNKEYCDFICWTPHGMHVERMVRNAAAFDAIRPSLDAFFKDVLLPRLLRGQSSNKENKTPNTSCSDGSSNTGTKYCWCQQGSMGEWLHVTILSVLGNGSTIDVLDLLVNHVANGIVVTYVRIIIESVIIESVCSLIKKQASLILILKFN